MTIHPAIRIFCLTILLALAAVVPAPTGVLYRVLWVVPILAVGIHLCLALSVTKKHLADAAAWLGARVQRLGKYIFGSPLQPERLLSVFAALATSIVAVVAFNTAEQIGSILLAFLIAFIAAALVGVSATRLIKAKGPSVPRFASALLFVAAVAMPFTGHTVDLAVSAFLAAAATASVDRNRPLGTTTKRKLWALFVASAVVFVLRSIIPPNVISGLPLLIALTAFVTIASAYVVLDIRQREYTVRDPLIRVIAWSGLLIAVYLAVIGFCDAWTATGNPCHQITDLVALRLQRTHAFMTPEVQQILAKGVAWGAAIGCAIWATGAIVPSFLKEKNDRSYFGPTIWQTLLLTAISVVGGFVLYVWLLGYCNYRLYEAYRRADLITPALKDNPLISGDPQAEFDAASARQRHSDATAAQRVMFLLLKDLGQVDPDDAFDTAFDAHEAKSPRADRLRIELLLAPFDDAVLKRPNLPPPQIVAPFEDSSKPPFPGVELIAYLAMWANGSPPSIAGVDLGAYRDETADLIAAYLADAGSARTNYPRACHLLEQSSAGNTMPVTKETIGLHQPGSMFNAKPQVPGRDIVHLLSEQFRWTAPSSSGTMRPSSPLVRSGNGQDAADVHIDGLSDALGRMVEQLQADPEVKAWIGRINMVRGPEQAIICCLFMLAALILIWRATRWTGQWFIVRRFEQQPVADRLTWRPPVYLQMHHSLVRRLQDAASFGSMEDFEEERLEIERTERRSLWLLAWVIIAIPAIDFVGTVRGISQGLGSADGIVRVSGGSAQALAVTDVTTALGLAFATTVIALTLLTTLTLFERIMATLVDSLMHRVFRELRQAAKRRLRAERHARTQRRRAQNRRALPLEAELLLPEGVQ